MAHISDKLGLVLTGDLQLAALLRNLVEEACILECNCRLIGESLHETDDRDWKFARLATLEHKRAERLLASEQGDNKPSAQTSFNRRVT